MSVRGLSERYVDSDKSSLKITISKEVDNLEDFRKEIKEEKSAVLALLKKYKIDFDINNELWDGRRIYLSTEAEAKRRKSYDGIYKLKVLKLRHDACQSFQKDFRDAKSNGKFIHTEIEVSHQFTKLQDFRPEMLAEATKSARLMAEQFAKDSDTKVGGIIHADQGAFSIGAADEETADVDSHIWDDPKSFRKRVRVVSRITFALQ